MTNLRRVDRGAVTYALISRRGGEDAPGFFTPADALLQVGIVDHPAGYVSKPHKHLASAVSIDHVCEVLFVESGRIEVQVFDDAWNALAREVLAEGDCVVFMHGGHAVRALEPTRLVEVKQGPYPGDGRAKSFLIEP